jgi:flagellar protein FliS
VHGGYLAIDVTTAPPIALVSRLFARMLQHLRVAHASEPSAERTRSLSRALAILTELRSTLDFAAGGELARNLERLYDFAAQRISFAAASGTAPEVQEALAALEPIASAFAELASSAPVEGLP